MRIPPLPIAAITLSLALCACGDAGIGPGPPAEAEATDDPTPADAAVDLAPTPNPPDAVSEPDDPAPPSDPGSPEDVPPRPVALGTLADPIVVPELPWSDSRDTSNAPSAVFDAYGCALETNEGGDGFVYRVTVTTPGILTATLDDVSGDTVDVDVHLLDAPDADACLIRDNVSLSWPVGLGEYLVVVDTWVNGSGEALSGPYTLDLALIPDVPTEAPPGTTTNPIVVTDLPYTDARDTTDADSDVFDSYGCAPNTDESGPEFVYRLSLPGSGTLTAAVSDGSGVDIDLHLLSSLDPQACVVRHDTGFEQWVGAGTWYVVADTWVNGAGIEQPGPYTLEILFAVDDPGAAPQGSVTKPFVVTTFPFSHSGDTAWGVSDAFDSYGCAPGIDESGPEVIYEVHVPFGGVLQASVSDLPGDSVDVDVHLLSALDPSACLARANASLSHAVAPGIYYVIADTWVSKGGAELAGPYTLSLSLIGEPALDDFCLILYGDTRGSSSSDPQVAHSAVAAAIADRCGSKSLVHSGDFVRSGYSTSDWETFQAIESALQEGADALYPTRGNHDGSWANILDRLGVFLDSPPPGSVYAQALTPKLTLLALDSEGDAAEQATWLAEQLDSEPAADHRFVVAFHRPLYPSIGGHSGWGPGKTHWMPILESHAGRVLVTTGHNHGMSRELVGGVTFFTAGGGGAPLYGCGKAHAGTQYCASAYGYVACDAQLVCVVWEVDPETGDETMGDIFSLSP